MVPFSVKDIRAAVSNAAFEKANDYFRRGRVVEHSVLNGGDLIRARTQGDAREPYVQVIRVEPLPNGRVDFEGECSCPMSYNCKHVAAALLDVLADGGQAPAGKAPPPPPPLEAPLPYELQTWLGALHAARDADSEAYPDDEPTRLFYILSTGELSDETVPRLMVRPVSGRLRKDGSMAQRGSRVDSSIIYRAPKYFRPADRWIMRRLNEGWSDGEHEIRSEEAGETLKRILATGRALWQAMDGAVLSEGPPVPARVVWRVKPSGRQSTLIETADGVQALRTTPAWYVDRKAGVMGPLVFDTPPVLTAALLGAPELHSSMVERVRVQMARTLNGARVPMPAELPAPETLRGRPKPCLTLLPGRLTQVDGRGRPNGITAFTGVAELSFLYGPIRVPARQNAARISAAHEGKLYTVDRHKTAESEAEKHLASLGIKRVPAILPYASPAQHLNHFMLARDDDHLGWLNVLHRDVPALRAKGWNVEIADDFPHRLARYDGEMDADLRQGSDIDWFDLELGVEIDGVRFDLVPALMAFVAAGDRAASDSDETIFVPLDDGRRLAVPASKLRPLLTALAALFRSGAKDGDGERLRFATADAADLAALEAATAEAGVVWRGGEALRALGHKLRQTDGVPNATVPASFGASLRAYQQRGVDWLQFLREVGFGGVLADDMGLGKTVQTLAHLLIEKESGRMDRPALIVCPTSLVANWLAEAQRFAPGLSVLTLHGAARKTRFDDIGDHDVVITTYPLLARDHEVLTGQAWHIAILDEAQMIKNPDALTAKLAGKLDARQRLCLSGTPLENHLGELWSLFSFAAPGFLGERRAFNTRYRGPIERLGDTVRRTALAARVRPFILRRTKDEVLTDLPPKTDISEAVELGVGQRALYEAIRLTMHARVREAIAKAGLARSQITILDALLKLRQACCDPRLVKLELPRAKKTAKGAAPAGSAKLERVMEMVPTMIEEGRRILLFSQFTSMLALIEAALDKRGVAYALLTGETRDRATQINRFQSGKVPLFLISLKAGGQGLNLTAADTVIQYDPWWNPAVEDQAAARAHRIGQTKPVFVHKLMTVGTIEEKMDALKARKRDLVAGILDGALKSNLALSQSDVEALFAPA